jgi:hypothetical protein
MALGIGLSKKPIAGRRSGMTEPAAFASPFEEGPLLRRPFPDVGSADVFREDICRTAFEQEGPPFPVIHRCKPGGA